jgi:hypothetical protein
MMSDVDDKIPPTVADAMRHLRPPAEPDDEQVAAIVGAVRRDRRTRLWSGVTLAAAAALVLMLVRPGSRQAELPVADTVARSVVFEIDAPDAHRVALVGDFNAWDASAHPMTASAGRWELSVPLTPGRYTYAFIVDGESWRADPTASLASADDFSRPSSVVVINPVSTPMTSTSVRQ